MARFYAYPYNANNIRFIKTLLISFILILCAKIDAQAQTPAVTSFTPSSGPVGTEITITGSNFASVTTVSVGGGSTLDFTVVSSTQIKVTVPATASTGRIQVQSNQGSASSATNYALTDAPEITSFAPVSGPVGTEVTITGSNFTGATVVSVGGGSITDFTVVSANQIKVKVPKSASTGNIRVYSNQGTAYSSENYTLTNAPTVTSFTPSSGPVGTEITITGSNFASVTTVSVGGGSTLDFTVVSSTQIKVTVPATASTGRIQVQSNQGSASSATNYALTDAPEITSFAPVSGPVGTEVTITGSNFTGATVVYVGSGSITDFTVVSDTEIRAIVPISASTGRIQVQTPQGKDVSSGTYVVEGAPIISSFTPYSGSVGTVVSIFGRNFIGASIVYVGSGSTYNFTVVSDTEIQVPVPVNANSGTIRVYSNKGQTTSSGRFTLTNGPQITSFTPASGPVGTTVTITGSNFTGTSLIYIGSGSTTNFTVVNDSEIKVTVPSTATTGKLLVRTASGQVYSTGTFTVTGVPQITSFTPTSGPVGTEVTITGSNFTGTTRVYVGSGSTTTGFTLVSDSEIRVTVPATANTGILRVETPNGRAYSSRSFTVTGAPQITFFTPASGPVGTTVTITGSNFTGTSLIYIGSGSTTNFTVVNDSEIKVTVPSTATTGKLLVRTASGQVYSTGTFTVTGAPQITSFTPTSGPVGTEVTITGSNFTGTTRVYVGSGSTTTGFTLVSDSEIRVTVPATATNGSLRIQSPVGQVYSSTIYTVLPPSINVGTSELNFADVPVGSTQVKEYQVSGLGLKNGEAVTISLGATSPYTISTNAGSGFGKSVTLNTVSNNKLNTTSIFVKYEATVAGEKTDVILHQQGTTASKSLNIRGNGISPLPVELIAFNAVLKNGQVNLSWSTASEKDNSHFEIEKASGSLSNFRKIDAVKSKVGTSATTTNYSFSTYYNSNGATEYYRLKQVDLDGKLSYSKVVSVKPSSISKQMEVAPNPISEDSKIYFTADADGKAIIKVTSVTGKQIYFEQIDVHGGENAVQLSKYSKLMPSVYIVTVEHDGKRESVRIEKK